jgi:hypothetical protein
MSHRTRPGAHAVHEFNDRLWLWAPRTGDQASGVDADGSHAHRFNNARHMRPGDGCRRFPVGLAAWS